MYLHYWSLPCIHTPPRHFFTELSLLIKVNSSKLADVLRFSLFYTQQIAEIPKKNVLDKYADDTMITVLISNKEDVTTCTQEMTRL